MASNSWATTPLGELCEAERGITYGIVKVGDFIPGGVPVIRGGDIRDGRIVCDDSKRVTEAVSNQFRRTILKGGELVINLIAEPGHSAIVPDELAGHNVSRDVAVIPLNAAHDVRYVDYFLKSKVAIDWLTARLQGSVTQKINLGTLRELPVPLPPLPEQRAIAHVLGSLDDLIELNRETNQLLGEMARALFNSWFVDFDPVRAKLEGRQPAGMDAATADLFPEHFQDSKLGQIPRGWAVDTLGSVLETLETGRRPKGGVSGYSSGVPSVGAESINGIGVFDFSKTKFIPRDFYDRIAAGRVQNLDVLLYKDGGKPGEFRPRVGLFGYGFPFDEFCINEHVFRMRAESVGQHYLYFTISDERVLLDFANKGGKAAIPGINQTDVRSTLILMPPQEILAAFEAFAQPICQTIIENAGESRDLAAMRDTLLPKLLSGETTVPVAEELLAAAS